MLRRKALTSLQRNQRSCETEPLALQLGQGGSLLEDIRQRHVPIVSKGTGYWSFVHIRNGHPISYILQAQSHSKYHQRTRNTPINKFRKYTS